MYKKYYKTIVEVICNEDGEISLVQAIARNNKEACVFVDDSIKKNGLQQIYALTGQVYRRDEVDLFGKYENLMKSFSSRIYQIYRANVTKDTLQLHPTSARNVERS